MEKQKKMRVICIGAGASGLFFALNCASEDREVLLFDTNPKAGRKMYISGKGRCNITNDCDTKEFIKNIVRNPRFLYSAINRFSPSDTIAFFNEHGCPLKTERGKRVFPVSDHSADIIDCLYRECLKRKVLIRFAEKVKMIEKKEDHFLVISEKKEYEADKVVIATGGKSYSSTGSTGVGYDFAQSFGHTIIPLRSALCPIRVRETIDRDLWKLTLKNVSLRAFNDRFDKTIFGDLEFLPDAISGPVVLSMSSLINREEDVKLTVDLKPALDEEKLDRRLLREIEGNSNRDVRSLMKTLLPSEMVPFFLEHAGIDGNTPLHSLNRESRKNILHSLKAFPFTFAGLEDIEKGIVTSGGVDVKEIDPKTMESKLCDGLYFIGEILDVDAFTGGFNLQSALSTGYACAMAIREQNL